MDISMTQINLAQIVTLFPLLFKTNFQNWFKLVFGKHILRIYCKGHRSKLRVIGELKGERLSLEVIFPEGNLLE